MIPGAQTSVTLIQSTDGGQLPADQAGSLVMTKTTQPRCCDLVAPGRRKPGRGAGVKGGHVTSSSQDLSPSPALAPASAQRPVSRNTKPASTSISLSGVGQRLLSLCSLEVRFDSK